MWLKLSVKFKFNRTNGDIPQPDHHNHDDGVKGGVPFGHFARANTAFQVRAPTSPRVCQPPFGVIVT